MAIKSYFYNALLQDGVYNRLYNADDVTDYLDKLVGNGVFPTPSTQLQVRSDSGMTVIVGAGSGWINGHKMVNTADTSLTLDASDVLLGRIDAVIFYSDYNAREMGIAVKKGTVAVAPVAPELQQDASRFELCLAHISVPKQTTSITDDMITDTRGDSSLCGYVQGLIQQLDTTTLFQQWQAAFDAWFEAVQDQFEAAKVFKRYEGTHVTEGEEDTFTVTDYVSQYRSAYDVLELYINGIHVNTTEYALVNGVVTLTVPISEAGAVVTFTVFQLIDEA